MRGCQEVAKKTGKNRKELIRSAYIKMPKTLDFKGFSANETAGIRTPDNLIKSHYTFVDFNRV